MSCSLCEKYATSCPCCEEEIEMIPCHECSGVGIIYYVDEQWVGKEIYDKTYLISPERCFAEMCDTCEGTGEVEKYY